MEIYSHRLSQKQAKEGPRLLKSLAGAETVVFRVQGVARRVGLFREVGGGSDYYPAPLCPLNLWKAGFKDPQREREKGLGDLGMGFSGLEARGLSVLPFLSLVVALGLKPEPGGPRFPPHTHLGKSRTGL